MGVPTLLEYLHYLPTIHGTGRKVRTERYSISGHSFLDGVSGEVMQE